MEGMKENVRKQTEETDSRKDCASDVETNGQNLTWTSAQPRAKMEYLLETTTHSEGVQIGPNEDLNSKKMKKVQIRKELTLNNQNRTKRQHHHFK